MISNPHVGQRVKLSRVGYASLKPDSPEMCDDAREMIITGVSGNIGSERDPIYDIQVNKPLINQFMLMQTMFDELS